MTNPMNTNEDIKFLAENLMGWSPNNFPRERLGTPSTSKMSKEQWYIDTQFNMFLMFWNPYTNTDDFLEVVREVPESLRKHNLGIQNEMMDDISITVWMVDHKSEVLTALIETLEQEKG